MRDARSIDHLTVTQLRAFARAAGMDAAELYRQSAASASASTSAGSSSRTFAILRRA